MRTTYVGPLPPHEGGIAQHGANLTDALVAGGHAVRRISWGVPYPRRLYPGHLPDPTTDRHPRTGYPLDWSRPASWVRVGRAAREGDGLVLPWVTTIHTAPTVTILRQAGAVPAVGVIHNALPHERHPLDEALARRVLRRLDGALVHAGAVAEEVHRLVPGLPVAVVPHPPNLPLRPTPLPEAPPVRALLFGLVRAYKGVEIALDAVRACRDRGLDLHLSIVGRCWEPRERWQREIVDRGLDDVVTLEDRYVPDDEVAGLFARHHLVLAPYRSATQSGIVPLAYAAGRPVVATDVGGLSEAVTDGDGGALTLPDGASFATGMARVVDDLPSYAARAAAATTAWSDVAAVLTDLLDR